MKHLVSVLVSLVSILVTLGFLIADASADPYLTCEPYTKQAEVDRNPDHFLLQLDTGEWISTPAVEKADGKLHLWFDMKDIPEGSHVIVAKAVNAWGESEVSDPLSFTKTVPAKPASLKFGLPTDH